MAVSRFDNLSQPRSVADKRSVVSGAFGNDRGTDPKNNPKNSNPSKKFHGMDIEAASNGVMITHRVKHFRKNNKEEGASDHPTFEDIKHTKHVINGNHPMMEHVNALIDHCDGECDPD